MEWTGWVGIVNEVRWAGIKNETAPGRIKNGGTMRMKRI